jgi:hypothetical protein
MNSPDPEEQKIIDQLLLENALEVVGIDDSNGKFLYAFTNKIKDVMPDLYEDHLNFVNSEIMTLWEKGYLDIDFLEENPAVRLAEKAVDKEELGKLTTQELWSLEEIKRLLKNPEV